MKYKKINEATVQCIISEEDMEEYGLTLSDIFERNEKGEGFLRNVVEKAHDEVGYHISGDNIAMQITPLRDEGLVITFSDEGLAGFQNMLEHIKEVLSGLDPESIKEASRALVQKEAQAVNELEETCRIFVFASMNHVMRYCGIIPMELSVKSHLYKLKDTYYLVIEKQRLSKKNFNKISAEAVEFAKLAVPSEEKLLYLEEHGECLIQNKAVRELRKICRS
ncbi:MAG: adaptor protein MecA [Roseburia sp.]|nr:adaptor protein MecA [Ruminococcus sp.]MCM1155013.1 adaptor protein MecA [Roseburia sp.]MCM1242071.1 adaptor protein MecA [Roseburia sp.]